MTRITTTIMLTLSFGLCFAQDMSMWTSKTTTQQSEMAYFMWVTHVGPKFTLDVRQGFDAPNTFGGYVGTTPIGKDSTFWIIPEIGGIIGDQKGFGPELLAGGTNGRFRYFMFAQYVFGVESCESFFFTYDEIHYELKNKGPRVGTAVQMFWGESQTDFPGFDIGPQMRIPLGKSFYLKPWYTWNLETGKQKFITGLGYTFQQ